MRNLTTKMKMTRTSTSITTEDITDGQKNQRIYTH